MKLFHAVFLLFWSLVLVRPTHAQTPSELANTYEKKLKHFKNSNADSVQFYVAKLKALGILEFSVKADLNTAYQYYRKREFDHTLKLLDSCNHKLTNYLRNTPDAQISPAAYEAGLGMHNRYFWTYKNLELYEEAFKHLLQAEKFLSYYDKTNSYHINTIGLTINKSVIKNKLNLPLEAIEIIKKALQETTNLPNDLEQHKGYLLATANLQNVLGNSYYQSGILTGDKRYLDSALVQYNKGYAKALALDPPHKDTPIIHMLNKVKVLIAQEDYKQALGLVKTYKSISAGYPYKKPLSYQKALCYYHLQQTDSAIFFAEKFLKYPNKTSSKLIEIYKVLSTSYFRLNQTDSASKYSDLTLSQIELAGKHKYNTYHLFLDHNRSKAEALQQAIEKKTNKQQKAIFLWGLALLTVLLALLLLVWRKRTGAAQPPEEIRETVVDQKGKEKSAVSEKKTYNIDPELERHILSYLEEVDKQRQFLKPDFSIQYLAAALETNTTYISYVFNEHKHMSFTNYYAQQKINYIVAQLKDNPTFRMFTVQALAEEAGYKNASSFTRAFKKQIGQTPSAYITELKQKKESS
ncbi:putative AraC-type DNA-binding protein [Tenacibaculum litopenaei]|uniref:helix-turn-helix domain-containing protein n=1 Tax=Tenacibaculum litopenaei TaxID=396016 RepID=UPI003895770E